MKQDVRTESYPAVATSTCVPQSPISFQLRKQHILFDGIMNNADTCVVAASNPSMISQMAMGKFAAPAMVGAMQTRYFPPSSPPNLHSQTSTHLPSYPNRPPPISSHQKYRLTRISQARCNIKNDSRRLLPNPRCSTKTSPRLPPPKNLPTTNTLDPLRVEPYHRLRCLWRVLRFWCCVPGLSVVWVAFG